MAESRGPEGQKTRSLLVPPPRLVPFLPLSSSEVGQVQYLLREGVLPISLKFGTDAVRGPDVTTKVDMNAPQRHRKRPASNSHLITDVTTKVDMNAPHDTESGHERR